MANRYLVATGVYSSTAIWSATSGGAGGASVPGVSDTINLDASSSGYICTLDQVVSVLSLSMVSGTGVIDTSSTDYSFTVSTVFAIASGTFYANASAISVGTHCLITGGTFTADTSTVSLVGSGNLYNATAGNAFYNLTQVGAVTTTATGDVYIDNIFTTSNTGTVTDDGGGTRDVHILGSLVVGGVTWLSVSTLALWFGPGTTIPSDDYGNINIRVRLASTGTVTMGGDVTTTNGVLIASTGNNATSTLDTGGFDFSCAELVLGASGQTLRGGEFAVTGVSTVEITAQLTVYTDDGTQVNGITVAASGTNGINIGGDWTVNTGATMDMQDSVVTFNGSGTQEVTSGGESFADVIINCSGTVELQDALDCVEFTMTAGSFDDGGFAVTAAGLVNVSVYTTFTASGTWIQTVDADFKIHVWGTDNTTAMSVILQGTGTLVIGRIANMTCAAAGKVTSVATRAWRVDGVLTLGTGRLTNYQALVANNPGGFVLAPGYTWDGTGAIEHQVIANATYPALTTTNGLSIRGYSNGHTVQLGGILSVGFLEIRVSGAGRDLIFTTNGFAITCTAFTWGTPLNGVEDITLNMGASVVSCTSYCDPGLNGTATQTINMGTSQWTCTGAWIFQSNHTINEGTSTVDFNGSGAQAVTSNGKQFYTVEVTNTGGTVTFVDAPDIQGTFKPGNGASTVTLRFPTSGTTHWEAVDTSAASGTGTIDLNSIGEAAPWALTIGSNQTVTSVDVTYSDLTGFTIDATDPTNVDGGNNSANWVFTSVVAAPKMYYYRRQRS